MTNKELSDHDLMLFGMACRTILSGIRVNRPKCIYDFILNLEMYIQDELNDRRSKQYMGLKNVEKEQKYKGDADNVIRFADYFDEGLDD